MTTKDEPLSRLGLAVAVAESVMGWPIRHVTDYERNSEPGEWPYLLVRSSPEYTELIVHYTRKSNGDRPEGWHIWEPWRDMRAAWEVVEKMQADGYSFECKTTEDGGWYVAFDSGGDHCEGYFSGRTDFDTPCLAILRAALATLKGQSNES